MELVYYVLIWIVGIAVVYDLGTYKIPNALVVSGLAAGFVIKGFATGPPTMLNLLGYVVLTALVLMPMYLFKALGAGDIKLFCMISVFLGYKSTILIVAMSLLIGALIGSLKIIYLLIVSFSIKQEKKIDLTVMPKCRHHMCFSVPIFGALSFYLLFYGY